MPVVVGRVTEEARVAIEGIARERGAPVVPAWDGVSARRVQSPPGEPTRIQLRTPARDYGEVALSLRGDHQIGNAVVAIRVLEQLHDSGIDVPPAAIVDGLAHVSWPGRLEHRRLAGWT